MLLLVAFQVLMLNHLQISGYGTPIIIACMVLYMPLAPAEVTLQRSDCVSCYSAGLHTKK